MDGKSDESSCRPLCLNYGLTRGKLIGCLTFKKNVRSLGYIYRKYQQQIRLLDCQAGARRYTPALDTKLFRLVLDIPGTSLVIFVME